jgi:hypothetical protein
MLRQPILFPFQGGFPVSFRYLSVEAIPIRGSMMIDLKREALRRTAHLQKAEEILEGWVPSRTEHAAQALLVYLQLPGNIGIDSVAFR